MSPPDQHDVPGRNIAGSGCWLAKRSRFTFQKYIHCCEFLFPVICMFHCQFFSLCVSNIIWFDVFLLLSCTFSGNIVVVFTVYRKDGHICGFRLEFKNRYPNKPHAELEKCC